MFKQLGHIGTVVKLGNSYDEISNYLLILLFKLQLSNIILLTKYLKPSQQY